MICFNVATAFTPWKTVGTGADLVAAWLLQCGHGIHTVENEDLLPDLCREARRLQCGHGIHTVENMQGRISAGGNTALQCGHGIHTVENGPHLG